MYFIKGISNVLERKVNNMERDIALVELNKLKGEDLYARASEYGVTTWINKPDGTRKQNKGWFGHVIEHYLGLPQNSAQSPNFGSWELKTTSLKTLKDGSIAPKETLAITMIDPYEVVQKTFEDSHLYSKLKKLILVSRIVSDKFEDSGIVYSVNTFDLNDVTLLKEIKEDYDLIRNTLIDNNNRISCLTGKMGKWIQPRTKGAGHGSESRAFYARKILVKKIIGL